jgi:hypothetical protein
MRASDSGMRRELGLEVRVGLWVVVVMVVVVILVVKRRRRLKRRRLFTDIENEVFLCVCACFWVCFCVGGLRAREAEWPSRRLRSLEMDGSLAWHV